MSTTLTDKYINFFTDYGFKRLFGEERNKDLLIDFLNTLLNKQETIKTLSFYSPEKQPPTKFERKAIFDLFCENKKGEKFIIELQKAKQNYFKDRTIYYSTFPIQEQALRGDWNFKLKAVYTIGILDFCFDDGDKDKTVVTEVKLMNTVTKKVFYNKLSYIYLQMPNFTKKASELLTKRDKWLFAIKNLQDLEDKPEILSGIFKKFFEEAEIANYTIKEIKDYEHSLKVYRDLKNTIDTARDEGKEEGKEEGREEGREETEKRLNPIIKQKEQEKQKAEQEKQKAEQDKQKAELKSKVVLLYYAEKKSIKEIAAITKKNEDEIKQ